MESRIEELFTKLVTVYNKDEPHWDELHEAEHEALVEFVRIISLDNDNKFQLLASKIYEYM